MAELARIIPAAAIACPGCQARLTKLPLDALAAGDGYDCPHCGQPLRIPDPVLARLLQQREALGPDFEEEHHGPISVWQRMLASLKAAWHSLVG